MNDHLPIFEMTRTVAKNEIDYLDHVNNVVYVQWANDIAMEHWTTAASKELLQTYDWVMIKHCIEYKQSAMLGDPILIRTQVGRATNVRYERFIEIYNKETMTLLAKTTSDWCAIDKAGKPVRISQELRDLFEIT
ncbi:acyl-CoA thioesterase [Nonlabens marinus]|uniref:Thioesterase superfamily n=1 Tax=Nonlabens marinus S1-08 TaxID=1454201 RepID=W8VXH9_9FLAO|nr:thioesterase family protein [Nonlabens marinus]BAO55957.1 thioesterase superfamily [Nonlabens marinus S1-08]